MINRFHEVYNSINVLFNTDRLKAIMELFNDHSIIANLKTNAIYLDGKTVVILLFFINYVDFFIEQQHNHHYYYYALSILRCFYVLF